jgi:hypothetical protein
MSETVAAALAMFQRYLQEEIPPAAASYALATLMAQPPDVLMQQVATWTAEQSQARSVAPRDLLLLALKKIYITGELNLLDREAVANYLDRATGVALRLCPDADRDQLRSDFSSMQARGGSFAVLYPSGVSAAQDDRSRSRLIANGIRSARSSAASPVSPISSFSMSPVKPCI